jgi:hypothetical protein
MVVIGVLESFIKGFGNGSWVLWSNERVYMLGVLDYSSSLLSRSSLLLPVIDERVVRLTFNGIEFLW